jgi:hypothetical protein
MGKNCQQKSAFETYSAKAPLGFIRQPPFSNCPVPNGLIRVEVTCHNYGSYVLEFVNFGRLIKGCRHRPLFPQFDILRIIGQL